MSTSAAFPFRAEIARKALHVATAALPVALSFGLTDQRTLQLVLSAAVLFAFTVETLRVIWPAFRAAFLTAFSTLLRPREHVAFTGATWLAIAMALVLWLAPVHAAIAALWAAAVGDAAAAVVGRSVGKSATVGGKTLAGSLAALIVTTFGALWLTPASLETALALGVVAAIAERPTVPIDDNLRIALAVALAATGLGLR